MSKKLKLFIRDFKIYLYIESIYLMSVINKDKKILVLGDSHSKVFKKVKHDNYNFIVLSLPGATASGLKPPNNVSVTNSYSKFLKAIKRFRGKNILFNLGEVDTGFIIFHRFENQEISLNDSIIKTVNVYTDFISKFKEEKNVYCMSCTLPILKRRDFKKIIRNTEDINLRYKIKANLKERISVTNDFNKMVEKFCDSHNIKYINTIKDIANDNGYTRDELIRKDVLDHHYDENVYANIISNKLKKIIF